MSADTDGLVVKLLDERIRKLEHLRDSYMAEQKEGPVDHEENMKHYWTLEGRIKQVKDEISWFEAKRRELEK